MKITRSIVAWLCLAVIAAARAAIPADALLERLKPQQDAAVNPVFTLNLRGAPRDDRPPVGREASERDRDQYLRDGSVLTEVVLLSGRQDESR